MNCFRKRQLAFTFLRKLYPYGITNPSTRPSLLIKSKNTYTKLSFHLVSFSRFCLWVSPTYLPSFFELGGGWLSSP